MKKMNYSFALLLLSLLTGSFNYAGAAVKLTTSAIAAADINQGTNTNIVYAALMNVTTDAVTVNNIQFTLSGTHDADDLTTVSVYFNATSPVISGASFLGSAAATFAGPHVYSISISRAMAAGTQGYFIITVNVSSAATDNHTVNINGKTNPVVFGFTTSPAVTDQQSNKAKTQSIQAADITLTTSPIAAADLNQGTNTDIIYAAKMDVITEPVTVSNIQFTLSGTHDNNDLSTVSVYFNAISPVISGASFLGSATATFAAPHTYSISISRAMAAGASGYFIITINVNSIATDNHTVKMNGKTDPVVFGFTTAPNVTNNQKNLAELQTIQAADITLTTSPVAVADLNQGTNTNIIYAAKMDVITEPVTVSNIQFTLTGSHDNNDLSTVSVYFNAISPVISGASFLGSATATFAAPHDYSISISRAMAAGSSGYFIITVNVNSNATDNRTVRINGKNDPVIFSYTTAPNITDNQKNLAGLQTIQAADITLHTSAVPAADINQGTNTNIVYVAQMDVVTEPVTVNNIQFTLSGNHDNNDLSTVSIYFNATSPVISGASFLGSATATFTAPHAYSISISRAMAAGSTGYFIITVNVISSATDNHTAKINGNTDPVVFSFTTDPNITNSQNNGGGTQTIQAADINLSTSLVSAGNIVAGSNTNIIYIALMSVTTEPVTVNNIQFTLIGSHDNTDLSTVSVYFNATSPVISGASFLGSAVATFAAPHDYSISISRAMAAGSSGYFIITVNVSATATIGNTVRINGSANPLVFGFSTSPNITNNQTNDAGVKTISASLQGIYVQEDGSNNSKISVQGIKGIEINALYPVPARDVLNYDISAPTDGNITILLTDASGKIMLNKTVHVNMGMNKFSFPVSTLANGVYYFAVNDGYHTKRQTKKVMVQH